MADPSPSAVFTTADAEQSADDGVPCCPYRIGEHARMLGRMLIVRLVISAVVAGVLTPTIAILVSVVLGGATDAASGTMARISAAIGSPIALGVVLMLVDYLLIRGRIAPAASMLTWAGRQEAAELRATTGIRKSTDRGAARAWLAAHVDPSGEDPATTVSRIHLQLVVGDVAGAQESVARLPTTDPTALALAALLTAQTQLAAGEPFDPATTRARIKAVPDEEQRALLHVDLAALIAQARSTCRDMDTLAPILAVRPLVGGRDGGILLRTYWAPMAALVLVSALVLALLFPG